MTFNGVVQNKQRPDGRLPEMARLLLVIALALTRRPAKVKRTAHTRAVDWGSGSPHSPRHGETMMPRTAEGTFEVKTAPMPPDEATAATSIARYSLDKFYRGDMEGASAGEMMGVGNPASGSAGYVAIEQFTGSLHGKSGSFAMQHSSWMCDGTFSINVRIVPGSGTGDLEGISGTLAIIIAGGKHSYSLEY